MKLSKKTARLALIAAVTAGVCLPLVNQLRNNRATAQTPPSDAPKPAPVSPFPLTAPDKVVLRIGDQTVTAGEVAALYAQLDRRTQDQLALPNGKRDLAEHFIKIKLMAAEARREKLDQSPLFKAEFEQLLGKALIYSLSADNGAAKKFFDDNKDWFASLKARHILIAYIGSPIESAKLTDAQAKTKIDEIKRRLDKGEDFAAIARIESDDRASAATGGDLGVMTRYQMVPAFEEAAYALKDKEISQPIKTQFGYHIIQVMGRTPATYEESAQQVSRRRLDVLIEDLRKTAKPVIEESYFGPAEGSKAAAPATQPVPGK